MTNFFNAKAIFYLEKRGKKLLNDFFKTLYKILMKESVFIFKIATHFLLNMLLAPYEKNSKSQKNSQ